MPLPNTRLIPDGWAGHHRPTAQGQMVDQCVITRPGGPGVWSDTQGRTVYPEAVTVYSGPCRVQQIPRGRRGGEELLTVSPTQALLHHYLIAIPADVTWVRINDELVLTVCVADPSLLTRTLRVADVLAGSLIWQRDLTCVDITPTGT